MSTVYANGTPNRIRTRGNYHEYQITAQLGRRHWLGARRRAIGVSAKSGYRANAQHVECANDADRIKNGHGIVTDDDD
jgi:hypothetical protein